MKLLCVDCKWFSQNPQFDEPKQSIRFGRCLNPRCAPPWYNKPDGSACLGGGVEQIKDGPISARVVRNFDVSLWQRLFGTGYACGRDGRWWEPKP